MPETEVVKIRITSKAKKTLDEVASLEYRTSQNQIRLILDHWAETVSAKTLDKTPRAKESTEVVKMRISPNAKDIINKMSIKASRSFQEQVRCILSDWAQQVEATKG